MEYDFDGQDYVYPLRMKITTVLKMDEAQTEDYIREKIALARQSRGKEQAKIDLDKVAGKNLEPEEVEEPEEEPEEPAEPEELEVLDEELEELDEELEEIAEPEESVESEALEEPEELEEPDE